MTNLNWFIIINPIAGNGAAKKQWPKAKLLLQNHSFRFKYAFTKYSGHATKLTITAINNGFKNIICVGGDGTLHAIVNGIMLQKVIETSAINMGIIPIGTGNDWIKTHKIPKKIENAIKLIKNNKTKLQDIGKIDFIDSKKPSVYFNNLAGIGFDGLVVKKTQKLKHLGKFSYLIAAFQALMSFKNFEVELVSKNNHYKTKSLMVLIGLCRYSGGGMRLTDSPNITDGLFDVTNVTNFTIWDFFTNLKRLYNGKINTSKKVKTFKTNAITVITNKNTKVIFIQADGELINAENIRVSMQKKALSFYY